MNLALVGHGAMGQQHLEVLSEFGVTPYIVVGAEGRAAQGFARHFSFQRATTNADEAITDPNVDLVVIASPNEQHFFQASTAIRAGKHVLIEIPIALSVQDAEELAGLAQDSKKVVMAAHTSRFYPAVQDLKARISSGNLHPHHIVCAMGTDKRGNQNWKGEKRDWTDNLMWHHGLHVIDTVLHLYEGDQVAAAVVHAGRVHPEHKGEMELSISLRFESRRLATIALTYHAEDQFTRYTVISDEAFLDYEQGRAGVGDQELTHGASFADLIRHQDGEFLSACRDMSRAPVSVDDVLPSMRLLGQLQGQLDGFRSNVTTPTSG